MGDFGGFVSTALGVVALVSLAVAALFASNSTGLRQSRDDAQNDAAAQRTRNGELMAENTTLKADLAALARTVTGEVHWVALGESLQHHHEQAEEHWRSDEDLLREILQELRRRP